MPTHTWKLCCNGSIPEGAAVCGKDKDGSDIYVGRAFHEGDMLPAKIVPSKGGAFVCYAGTEHGKTEYEALCDGTLTWQNTTGWNIPPDALAAGQTSDGETLYVGRVLHDGTLQLGKVHPSHGVCYIPYDGKELTFPSYDILVSK
ncbi:hypothetical protein L9F63_017964 [Diploptera punctata]|uniref:Uncharacterized protein n=1 Tax=Diploptera punctata TaxID=6984 RepID=A0AAD7ZXS8_DIPPU|nr:hypothetical protein L9F63_017964 [Diploptera punctata]